MGNSKSKNNDLAVIGEPSGEIGSQLFNIAATYAYSRKYNKRFLLKEDCKNISKNKRNYWGNILQFLKFNGNLVYNSQIKKVKEYNYYDVNYQEIPNFNHNILLKGNFQSEKYFKEYKNEINSLFKLPEYYEKLANLKLSKYGESIIVAIHINKGDYSKYQDLYHILSVDYYKSSKILLEEKLGFIPTYL
jgi:hypothetical protein